MKKTAAMAAAFVLTLTTTAVLAQTGAPAAAHQMARAQTLQWAPGPLPNSQLAVVSGDPSKPGPFVLRIKAADKLVIPAHWHPTDEHVTVLSGIFALGMGDKYDAKKLDDLKAGDYVMLPKEMRHYALSKGESVVQVHGMGPFVINWVNPADVPPPPPPPPAKKQK